MSGKPPNPAPSASPTPFREPKDVECWGHRGASAFLPENTAQQLASFRAAIKEGADGIESDVHVTSDGVILMFHDPTLDRTTDGTGAIKSQPWKDGIEHVRTKKEPVQPIPRFDELISLLMEPENQHVSLNIDCKIQNDPGDMFPEMARIIASHNNWETLLAPRLILGLWHPIFIRPALQHLPRLRRYHIGLSIWLARTYFWDACSGFSMNFGMLVGPGGQAFMRDCRAAGKEVCVWTVNDANEMRVALSWGLKAVLTDKVAAFVSLREEVVADSSKLAIPGLAGYLFPWSHWRYYSASHVWLQRTQLDAMRTLCFAPGPLALPDLSAVEPKAEVEEERRAGADGAGAGDAVAVGAAAVPSGPPKGDFANGDASDAAHVAPVPIAVAA